MKRVFVLCLVVGLGCGSDEKNSLQSSADGGLTPEASAVLSTSDVTTPDSGASDGGAWDITSSESRTPLDLVVLTTDGGSIVERDAASEAGTYVDDGGPSADAPSTAGSDSLSAFLDLAPAWNMGGALGPQAVGTGGAGGVAGTSGAGGSFYGLGGSTTVSPTASGGALAPSGGSGGTVGAPSATGGTPATGGAMPVSGGGPGTAGSMSASGGTTSSGEGGASSAGPDAALPATGGYTSSGGVAGPGGALGTGGSSTSTGGGASSGGMMGTGGSSAAGGTASTGGILGSGGSVGTGGGASPGGTIGTGGSSGMGGVISSGGSPATGGSVGTGGTTGTGGAGGGTGGSLSLGAALAAGIPAVFQLSGNATFTGAHYSYNGVSYPQSTAINFVVSRVSPIRFYVTPTGVKAVHPEYYQSVSTQAQPSGSITMSYAYLATKTNENYASTVTETSTSIDYSFVRQYTSASGIDYYQIADGTFSAGITALPQANWAPAPAYGFAASAIGSKGVNLSWKNDNDPGSIKEYQVLKNQQLIATVTSPTYADSDGLTCDLLNTCLANYSVIVVPKQGPSSIPATTVCSTMYLTPLSCLPASYGG